MNQLILMAIGTIVFFLLMGASIENTNERIIEGNESRAERAELEHQRALELIRAGN